MNTLTKNKIIFLQKYINLNYSKWFKNFNANVVGMRIDKKVVNNKKKNYYSIVFHVIEKVEEGKLEKKNILPKTIKIRFPDGEIKNIKTDVEETGRFRFHYKILDTIKDNTCNREGTLGLFLTDGRDVFALTNYHVAAWDLMERGIFYYDTLSNDLPDSLSINEQNVNLQIGRFSKNIDAAFIKLGPVSAINVSNNLADGTKIDNKNYVPGPISPKLVNNLVSVYTPSRHPNGYTVKVIDNSVCFNSLYKDHVFNGIIAIDLCTQEGDSGSIVISESCQMLGIIVGADDSYSYVIPYYLINNFKSLSII
jgi:hypothetical protein